ITAHRSETRLALVLGPRDSQPSGVLVVREAGGDLLGGTLRDARALERRDHAKPLAVDVEGKRFELEHAQVTAQCGRQIPLEEVDGGGASQPGGLLGLAGRRLEERAGPGELTGAAQRVDEDEGELGVVALYIGGALENGQRLVSASHGLQTAAQGPRRLDE